MTTDERDALLYRTDRAAVKAPKKLPAPRKARDSFLKPPSRPPAVVAGGPPRRESPALAEARAIRDAVEAIPNPTQTVLRADVLVQVLDLIDARIRKHEEDAK